MSVNISIKTGAVVQTLQGLDGRLMSRLHAVSRLYAARAEADMKKNAPWTDRTSNARNSLTAVPITGSRNVTGIRFSGDVPYMIFLENRWSGKYAIIKPTLLKYAPIVGAAYGKAIGK